MALTATATGAMITDVETILGIPNFTLVEETPNRSGNNI
jgi:superfamily II DNA helicase RecQ